MKIGILTQPLEENYGGILQAFALQQTLKNIGCESVVINRVGNDAYNRSAFIRIKHFLGRVYRFPKHKNMRRFLRPQYMEQFTRNKIFKNTYRFIRQYINSSPRLATDEAFLSYVQKQNFDAFIVGSDQCWRPMYSPNIYTYFLDFCKDKKDIMRISYAASFGLDEWEFTEEETAICSQLIQQFNAVSVREDSGIKLCVDYLKYPNAQHVLDPTLLLNPDDYIDLLKLDDYPKSEGDLMTYVLDKSEDKKKIVERIGEEKKLTVFSVIAPCNYYDTACYPLRQCIQPPVEKWLRGFMDAKFVIADSFHGCVFAILFNKPFIAIGNHERGLTRFTSLLKLFALEDRLVFSLEDATDELINKEIDWSEINAKREQLKKESVQFLKDNL